MKKFISLALAAMLAAGSLAVGVSAHKDFKSWGDVPATDEKITLDGKIDEIYNKGLIIDIATRTDGVSGGATGKAYFIWSGSDLYCAIEVKDPEICALDDAKNAWEQDGIELTYDWKNDGSTRHKWMVRYDGRVTKAGDASEDAIKAAATTADGSYVIEMVNALPDGVKAGSQIGINVLIDDMSGGNATRGIIRSVKSGDATENEVAKFDYIVLSADKVANEAPKAESPKQDVTQAAQTADALSLTAAAAIIGAAGVILFRKKRG